MNAAFCVNRLDLMLLSTITWTENMPVLNVRCPVFSLWFLHILLLFLLQVKSVVPFSEPFTVDPENPPPEKDYNIYFKTLKDGITGKESLEQSAIAVWCWWQYCVVGRFQNFLQPIIYECDGVCMYQGRSLDVRSSSH